MLVSNFVYHLPRELIAQKSVKPRDSSRLLVVKRRGKIIQHRHFYDLPKFLKKGDLLVFNDTKVFKARLFGQLSFRPSGRSKRAEESVSPVTLDAIDSSGRFIGPRNDKRAVEIFLLRPIGRYEWEVLGKPGKRLRPGAEVRFIRNLRCVVKTKRKDVIIVEFNQSVEKILKIVDKIGHVPVPPYIEKEPARLAEYQTIYARHLGSVAAPTAGFHFTPRLLCKLTKMGIELVYVTLHIGLGTFRPVKTMKVEEHKMHSEWAEISPAAALAINRAKAEGRRVIAVGTTVTRTLEGAVYLSLRRESKRRRSNPERGAESASPLGRAMTGGNFAGDINLFITPGFKFRVIDGLITNFHLPKSTLLMLVAAFIGSRPRILRIYNRAIRLRYRFFSFGDAMLII